jgi:MYXO-CTERM domain-containing protein
MFLADNVPVRRRRVLACVYTGLVAVVSLLPSGAFGGAPKLFPHEDTVAHFGLYGLLALALAWALRVVEDRRRRLLAPVATFCIAYGAALEWLQPILQPGDRTASMSDLLANAAGAVTCAVFLAIVTSRSRGA